MMSQSGQKAITILTLPNISRSKGRQTMKFGLVINIIMDTKIMQKTRQGDLLVPDIYELKYMQLIFNIF